MATNTGQVGAATTRQATSLRFDLRSMEIDNGACLLKFGALSFEMSDDAPFAAILGPSGSGKTTIVKSLFHYYREEWSQTGTFRIDENHRLNSLPLDQVQGCIGYAAQRPYFLPSISTRNNLLAPFAWTGKQVPTNESIEQVIQHFELLPFIDQKACFLSAGERQRLNLARMFLMSPQVAIIDECLSALDEITALQICETIKSDYASKCRIMVISHRSSDLAVFSDQKVELTIDRSTEVSGKRVQTIEATIS